MISRSQIRALHLGLSVIKSTSWSSWSDQLFCQHPPVTPTPLMGVLRHPINHSSQTSNLPLCLRFAVAVFKDFVPSFSLRCDNMMIVPIVPGYSWACWILFLVSLNTPNKWRAPFTAVFLPFTLLSLRALRDYTHRWFEFGPCPPHANIRHALNLSHILMDGGAGGRFADSWAIPLTLCLLRYLFDLIQGMRQNVQCESEAWKGRGVIAPQWSTALDCWDCGLKSCQILVYLMINLI